MKEENTPLTEIIGIDLSQFKVKEFFEVYSVDYDGKFSSSVGYFENEKIAIGFANIQVDADYHRVSKSLILTNEKIGFVLGKSITILNDEKAKLEITQKARAKLTDEEANALGIK